MKISVLKDLKPGEKRVALVPEVAGKLKALGHSVMIESGAGLAAGFTDEAYISAGAIVAASEKEALSAGDIVFCVNPPAPKRLPKGIALIGLLDPFNADLTGYNAKEIITLAMEFTPRITRAQSMDALSSQSNLAGYRAIIEAVNIYGRAMPMMMTAAGTIAPAKAFIMGAGVAGLQAIATARRLGAIVTATDVRPAAKEQVASLGAKFIAVEDEEFKAAETAGGYAKQMSAEYQAKQAERIAGHIVNQDIVITTALIPGRPAPVLVTEEMVRSMAPGSVIIDMAVAQGGNCPLSETGRIVEVEGVKIAGFDNLPASLPADTSALYAKNLMHFLDLVTDEQGALFVNMEDEIVAAMCLTQNGKIVNERLLA